MRMEEKMQHVNAYANKACHTMIGRKGEAPVRSGHTVRENVPQSLPFALTVSQLAQRPQPGSLAVG